jgi:hypothetical protein
VIPVDSKFVASGDVNRSKRSFTKRLLRFHLVWVALLLLALSFATALRPDPETFYGYFALFLPVSYLVIAVILAPVTVGIGLTVRWAIRHFRWSPRLAAAVVGTGLWLILIAGLAALTGPTVTGAGLTRAAITIVLAIPLFGLLMPLPQGADG